MIARLTKRTCMYAVLLFVVDAPATALGQMGGDAWLVLPVVVGEDLPDAAVQLAASAETALADRDEHVVAQSAVPDTGTLPVPIPAELRARLTAAVDPAIEDAAFSRRTRVTDRVNPLLEEVQRYIAVLGTDTIAARAVADLALLAARVHIESRDETAARATVERLLSLVPNPEPTTDFHRDVVLALLSRVRDRLTEGGSHARLRIESNDSGTCNAYVNGQLVGPTPITVPVYTGDYAVRLRCGEAESRTHLVHAESGEVRIEVSATLEAALRSEPRLHLRYGDAAALSAHARRDAARLAQRLGAERIVLVRVNRDQARLETLQREHDGTLRALGRATVSVPPSDDVGAAWVALFDAREERAPASEPHWASWAIGGALIVGGLAALISPLYTLAVEGQCVDASGLPEGFCRSEVHFGAQSGVLLGIGIAAIGGGVAFMAVAPLRVDVAASGSSARLTISGDL